MRKGKSTPTTVEIKAIIHGVMESPYPNQVSERPIFWLSLKLLRWKKGGSHPKFPHVPTRAVDLPGGPRTMGRSSSEEGGIISKTITWNCELWICTGLSLTALLRNLSTGVSAVELYSQCQGLSTLLSLMYVGRDAEEIPT